MNDIPRYSYMTLFPIGLILFAYFNKTESLLYFRHCAIYIVMMIQFFSVLHIQHLEKRLKE